MRVNPTQAPRLLAGLAFYVLGACSQAADAPPTVVSCAADIGASAAAQRVEVCREVSPATHPPCNAVNSCAMIEDEIARSCALFDGQGEPMAGCVIAPVSQEAAVAVVQRFYSALNAQDFATAWTQWGEDGPSADAMARYQKAFAEASATEVTIGALPALEGAAGSIYQSVPVTVQATLKNGRQQRWIGAYTVRRVSDVDGASAEQRRWHIESVEGIATP